MVKIGLTGNRYSGKDRTARLFEQITIPVFHADIILKFILNHNFEMQHKLKTKIGTGIFTNDGFLDEKMVTLCGAFDKMLDQAEFELFKAYEKFRLKNKQSIYTIFHSSILFERGWDKKMDFNINVFSPPTERMERCKYLNPDILISDIYHNMSIEMGDLDKNQKADYVIHNYEDVDVKVFGDLLTQVNKIDQKIIDKYLREEHKYKFI